MSSALALMDSDEVLAACGNPPADSTSDVDKAAAARHPVGATTG